MPRRRRWKGRRERPRVGLFELTATAAGFGLIAFPEPATTLAGTGIVVATWAPRVLETLTKGR